MHSGGHSQTALTDASATDRHSRRIVWALGLTLFYMAAEVVGGIISGSLALLADAAHMFTDAGGLLLALVAIWLGRRAATPQKTYGYLRAEILAALCNAIVLLLVTVYILYEAFHRFRSPPEIVSGYMLVIATIGLAVNLVCMKILSAGSSESLNVKGAYYEVLADMVGSIGVIIAGAIVMVTGWRIVDPLVGAGIGLFIIPRTWGLLNQAVHILLEGSPADINTAEIETSLSGIDSVGSVHDLHVWTITSGINSMSCHIAINDMSQALRVLCEARALMHERFKIDHTTIQIEDEGYFSRETPTKF